MTDDSGIFTTTGRILFYNGGKEIFGKILELYLGSAFGSVRTSVTATPASVTGTETTEE
jgi:hypothetical protein